MYVSTISLENCARKHVTAFAQCYFVKVFLGISSVVPIVKGTLFLLFSGELISVFVLFFCFFLSTECVQTSLAKEILEPCLLFLGFN